MSTLPRFTPRSQSFWGGEFPGGAISETTGNKNFCNKEGGEGKPNTKPLFFFPKFRSILGKKENYILDPWNGDYDDLMGREAIGTFWHTMTQENVIPSSSSSAPLESKNITVFFTGLSEPSVNDCKVCIPPFKKSPEEPRTDLS